MLLGCQTTVHASRETGHITGRHDIVIPCLVALLPHLTTYLGLHI